MHIVKESSSLWLFGIFLVSVRFRRESSLAGTQAAACRETEATPRLVYYLIPQIVAHSPVQLSLHASLPPELLSTGEGSPKLCARIVSAAVTARSGARPPRLRLKKQNKTKKTRGDSPPPPPGGSLTGVPTGSDQPSKHPVLPPPPVLSQSRSQPVGSAMLRLSPRMRREKSVKEKHTGRLPWRSPSCTAWPPAR